MADNLHVTTEHESSINWPATALELVYEWRREGLANDPPHENFTAYIVWFCFILGGWKALVSTTLPDGRYYEVTYNKEKKEAYIDTYKKTHNHAIKIT